ncbi:uncharacterized protein [Amphiura filiformis]|uniref:uncharacterized protein n=1 Tax=Amphiura filiformis TaxID=82378 RepID=UPI003B2233C0
MASKSLHESSSVTETLKDKESEKSNIHRQAKSHFVVSVGGPRHYADSDFVKPHESHAHLNLSSVMVTDDQAETSEASLHDQTSSLSETVIHHQPGKARSTSSSSSSDDEGTTTNTISKPVQEADISKGDQGESASAAPASTNDNVTDSVSSLSLDTNSIHSDSADTDNSSSWSSISNIEDNVTAENNQKDKPMEEKVDTVDKDDKEATATSPGMNIMALFKAGLFSVRRNALTEEKEKPVIQDVVDNMPERDKSSSGDEVDKIDAEALPVEEEETSMKTSDHDDNSELKAPKRDSSTEMQQPLGSEIFDDPKDATVIFVPKSDDATEGDDEKQSKDTESKESSVNADQQLMESFKSSDTAEFETLDMQSDGEEENEGFVTAETLPNMTNDGIELDLAGTTENTVNIDPGVTTSEKNTVDLEQHEINGEHPDIPRQAIVASNERFQVQGFSKSDSSVEVIYKVKKDSSSLDGLAIAEERESRESNQLQQEIATDTAEKVANYLQEELKSSKEETLRLKQQLDVQVMCEEYVRNEAQVEIEKAERKITKLQAQINKPPKLIHKHRKELRRIFEEIESEGGPSKVWTTPEGLQQAIRFLYWKRKDMESLLHETEQYLQITQTECTAWKQRSKEQEAAKEQLMIDLEGLQNSKSYLLEKKSKSDTCLSYGTIDDKSCDTPGIWGLQETSKQDMVNEMVEHLQEENLQLKQHLIDVQNLAQKQQLELNEAISQADLLKSKLDVVNSELIHERLHSQHLSTKLHNHNISAKNSMLLLAENLDDSTPPLDEAIPDTKMGDIDGLEDWLGHLKAGQQHTDTELGRYNDKLETLQDQINHLVQQKDCVEMEDTGMSEVDATRDKQLVNQMQQKKDADPVAELKLWQELHQLRDVQLETLKDLEDKDCKISDLQQRYSEVLAEQLQQRAKLEMDIEDNRSEKQLIQDQLEETQQLVRELHRKCVQLSQDLEEAHGQLTSQEETIQNLKQQFAAAMVDKQETMTNKDEENDRKQEELESRLKQIEEDAKQAAASEKRLKEQLESYVEGNKLLQKRFSTSSSVDVKLLAIHKEVEEIREAEQQFRNKYSLQDKELHHLHHQVSAVQTAVKQTVEEMVNTTLSRWHEEKITLQAQLAKTLTALDDSNQSRKATEDVNDVLMKNENVLQERCKTLTKQLDQEWMGHQKTVDKLNEMQTMLNQQEPTKVQVHQEHDDLIEWEHQLKEEAQRLSGQLHRIMGNHDHQVREMRDANTRLLNNLNKNTPQHSYHDNVSSARTKLQFLLKSSRPSSANPNLHYTNGGSVHQPHRNPFTPAQGLQSTPEELQTMSAAPLGGTQHRPATAFTSYTESYHFPSFRRQ